MARIAFRPLGTVEVRHAYWGGTSDVLQFVVPAATERVLAGARAMARERDGRLHLLAEVDAQGALAAPALVGQRLVFGLRPRHPGFGLVTGALPVAAGEAAVWDNAAAPDALAGPRGLAITGATPRLAARSGARPLTMRLLGAAGTTVAQTVLLADEDGWTPRLALSRGDWQVEEQAGAGAPQRRAFRVEPELAGVWGLLSVTVGAGHLQAPPRYVIDFAARADTLRYYVVATRHDETQFGQLQVVDTGFEAESREPIEFDRVEAGDFDDTHLPATLLDPSGSARVALFQARSAVPRRVRGPAGLELHRNGDVLVSALPQPGAERPDAQFVVHLSLP